MSADECEEIILWLLRICHAAGNKKIKLANNKNGKTTLQRLAIHAECLFATTVTIVGFVVAVSITRLISAIGVNVLVFANIAVCMHFLAALSTWTALAAEEATKIALIDLIECAARSKELWLADASTIMRICWWFAGFLAFVLFKRTRICSTLFWCASVCVCVCEGTFWHSR